MDSSVCKERGGMTAAEYEAKLLARATEANEKIKGWRRQLAEEKWPAIEVIGELIETSYQLEMDLIALAAAKEGRLTELVVQSRVPLPMDRSEELVKALAVDAEMRAWGRVMNELREVMNGC